jgi:3-hydroxyisobutyrate dehydrogenase
LVLKQASSAITDSENSQKVKLVSQTMAGVHLAAAAEAMALGKKVGLDLEQLYEIISTAAGASWMFIDRTPQLLSGKWSSKKTVDNVIAELVGLQPLHLIFC